MHTYIGCKIIKAEPMEHTTFLKAQGEDVTNYGTQPGYKVYYPNGYISWSPKEVFEEAYRLISNSEKAMI